MFTLPKLREIFTSEEETRKDILQVVISDMHSGSNYALFLNRVWQGLKGNNHTPTGKQARIRAQWETFAEEVRQARQGKKVRLIHNGDAIDGDHHASGDVCTLNELQQADIHIELMNELQKAIDWQAGDELYYTRGTQTHVHDYEYYIGEQMNAVPNTDSDGSYYCWDILKLNSNGAESWFVHTGPTAGKGANEGNPVTNWLKAIYYDALKDGSRIPDIVYTAHVHQPIWVPFGYRYGNFQFKQMHGVILPSWQLKTYFAWERAPVSKNRIGGVWHEIKADGTVCVPVFSVMESD